MTITILYTSLRNCGWVIFSLVCVCVCVCVCVFVYIRLSVRLLVCKHDNGQTDFCSIKGLEVSATLRSVNASCFVIINHMDHNDDDVSNSEI